MTTNILVRTVGHSMRIGAHRCMITAMGSLIVYPLLTLNLMVAAPLSPQTQDSWNATPLKTRIDARNRTRHERGDNKSGFRYKTVKQLDGSYLATFPDEYGCFQGESCSRSLQGL